MKTTPMTHQGSAVERSQFKPYFAYLFEQGCGKTWAAMYDAELLWEEELIDGMLVCAPKGVHTNWTRREIPTHMSIPVITFAWRGTPTSKKAKDAWKKFLSNNSSERKLRVFAINIDAFNTAPGRKAAEEFLDSFQSVAIVDEATRIKNPSAKRSQHVTEICRAAPFRRILTGTPITKGPLDLYQQCHFLKAGLLGTKSYRAFVSEYAVLVPANSPKMHAIMAASQARFVPQIVEKDDDGNPMWKNIEKLAQLLAPFSHRVRKVDCLDLPPKVRTTIYFELTSKQRKVYDRMLEENEWATQLDCNAFEAIAARQKMKQITSGFINIEGELISIEAEDNPRVHAFREALDNIEDGQQFIVWAMYKEEIRQIQAELTSRGIVFVTYDGDTKTADRELAIDNFQGGHARAFISNPQAGGIGITLTNAEQVIYFSCGYDLELRLQSEDRAHRIGQKRTVLYTDLVAEDTLDEDVMRALSRKSDIAAKIIDSDTLLAANNQA